MALLTYLNTVTRMVESADFPKDVSSAITRLDINELVEKAYSELNDKIFVCK